MPEDTDTQKTTTDPQPQDPQPPQPPQPGAGSETPPTLEVWLAAQDEPTRTLVGKLRDEDVKGLKSALDSEREKGRTLEKSLRDAASKAEAGSEAQKQLEAAAQQAETANARADFNEAGHAAGVADLRLAWLAVSGDESLLDRRGNVDFEKLREQHPALFAGPPKAPPGNAGTGAGGQQKGVGSMNDYIRAAAGRR